MYQLDYRRDRGDNWTVSVRPNGILLPHNKNSPKYLKTPETFTQTEVRCVSKHEDMMFLMLPTFWLLVDISQLMSTSKVIRT